MPPTDILQGIALYRADCMEIMKTFPNAAYDLAIVDIPYGLNVTKMPFLKEKNTMAKQKNGTKLNANKNKDYRSHYQSDWDSVVPGQDYFDELRRISRHQIIFGAQYTNWVGLGTGQIRWDKGVADGMSFNRYEFAYCSMINSMVDVELLWAGMMQAKSLAQPMVQQGNKKLNEKRIHPTQKPVLLYKKLLMDYAMPGFKIIDTHSGSLSIGVACHDLGFTLTAIEKDVNIYKDGKQRLEWHQKQLLLFKNSLPQCQTPK